MGNQRIKNLLRQIYEISYELPWLDESFNKKFNDIQDEIYFTQPIRGVHSIAEIVSHLVEWRIEILNRFSTGSKSDTMEELNWTDPDDLKKRGWASLKDAFDDSYADLKNLLAEKDDSFLETRFMDKSYGYLLEGWLHHDIYHMGQIGLVVKLLKMNAG